MNEFDGTFVSVEGIDGSGTTTLCENLEERLPDSAEFTHEPSTGKYGRIVRKELKSSSDPTISDMFLFFADRADHCESLIGPLLEKNRTVVTDRYHMSTLAYQSIVVEENAELGERSTRGYINDIASSFMIVPDITIYLDLEVEEAWERLDNPDEKYESKDYLEKVLENYRDIAGYTSIVEKVDATQSPEEITEEVISLIEEV